MATRRSFKAVITIVPTEESTKDGSWLIWMPWVFSTIILIATNTLYVKNLVVIGMFLCLTASINVYKFKTIVN